METLLSKIRNAKYKEGSASHLTEEEQQSLFEIIGKRVRSHNQAKLWRRLETSLALWPEYDRLERVHFDKYGVSYCAGQDYRREIKEVRELILKG